ncbi:MAG: GMC family oxidoreductase [Verrucomicrobia bacterium]|nr:GMC family oxidoreductase [Verrucomicrobiota bacterium]
MNEVMGNDPSGLDGIPPDADDPMKTAIDYIVVGSGPGGAPLAARLALAGMRVLVLEAGVDPGAPLVSLDTTGTTKRKAENEHLIYYCPGLHAASTEPDLHGANDQARTNWNFWVRHYPGEDIQKLDTKAREDPRNPGGVAVLYPRASALGGCTAHHAMISVYGADYDWQKIADLTGDNSWAPGRMRALYERIERARTGVWFGRLLRYWEWLQQKIDPGRDASARRGTRGWLDVQLSDPKLAMGDTALFNVVAKTVFDVEGRDDLLTLWRAAKRMIGGRLFRDLDLNDIDRARTHPEGVALVPLAVSPAGTRRGPREWLLETRRLLRRQRDKFLAGDEFGGGIWIATDIFVRRVIFRSRGNCQPLSAIGVEFSRGRHLYDPGRPFNEPDDLEKHYCYARREILLCGGAFNTPQILMLSGIGDKEQLRVNGVEGIAGIGGEVQHDVFVDLSGVGQNLLDRYEISVISEMAKSFSVLDGVKFDPNATDDKALNEWKAEDTQQPRAGLYATNGAAVAILKRSEPTESKPKDLPPDLLLLGFPIVFRGYYPGWSKDLLTRPGDGGLPGKRNLWSWTILKAYSKNRGTVRLRSSNPFDSPAIDFCYFGRCDAAKSQSHPDLRVDHDFAALKFAVQYVRRLNAAAAKLMKDHDAASAEIQPGSDKTSGSVALADWIMHEVWGHHASGTCRIGSDPWRANVSELKDKGAVLDSSFRVHGVRGLRVVDASVFPTIPGYFLTVPIYLVSEKAADTILDELSL